MSERKVASRKERLMFEQLIRQDMEYGIKREIIDSPQIKNNCNQNYHQSQVIIKNYNNINQNNQNVQTSKNISQNNNLENDIKRRALAQKFKIKTNKGKRDMVWEQKKQLKYAKYEQLMKEKQEYYDQQLSPKITPSNNNCQYQRETPSNQQRINSNSQPYNYNNGFNGKNYKREEPPNGQYNKWVTHRNGQLMYTPDEYQNRIQINIPEMTQTQKCQKEESNNYNQKMTPQHEYQREIPGKYEQAIIPPKQYKREIPNKYEKRVTPKQQYQRGILNNYEQIMTPKLRYQRESLNNNEQRIIPQHQFQRCNPQHKQSIPSDFKNENIQYNNNQRNIPQQPYQRNNNYQNDINSQITNNSNNRNLTFEYNQGRQSLNNNNNMTLRTPHPQFIQSRMQVINQYDNYNHNLKGSRTPFVDYKTGQNIYNQKRFTPGQNQYSDIPNRPPSRPFGEISFKQQNGGEDMENYKYNYSNTNNYY